MKNDNLKPIHHVKCFSEMICTICEIPINDRLQFFKHYQEIHRCEKYVCYKCNYLTDLPSELRSHFQHTHNIDNISICNEQKCIYYFQTEILLLEHRDLHHPDLRQCPRCLINIATDIFSDHTEICRGNQTYYCSLQCNARFIDANSLAPYKHHCHPHK